MRKYLMVLATAAMLAGGCGVDEDGEDAAIEGALGEATCGQIVPPNKLQATAGQIQTALSRTGYQNSVAACKNAFVVGITSAPPPTDRVSTSVVWEGGVIPPAQCTTAVLEAVLFQNGKLVERKNPKRGALRDDGTCLPPRLGFTAREMSQFSNTIVAVSAKLGATFKNVSVRAIAVN